MKEEVFIETEESKYGSYIVDFDGTMYDQPSLRKRMALKMLLFCLIKPWRAKEIYVIYLYRKQRESGKAFAGKNGEQNELLEIARKVKWEENKTKSVIYNWMVELPGTVIEKTRDSGLIGFLEKQQRDGKKVILYSDYPLEEKMQYIGYKPDAHYYSGDAGINCLKPDNKGLEYIIKKNGLERDKTLFIGDRMEKDGECAVKSKIAYLILPRRVSNRKWKK